MDFFENEDVKKSLINAWNKEAQPYELAVSRMVREHAGINLNDQTIIGIHRVFCICEDILRKQFNGKKEF